ncbi:MAG: Rrf2 family transcriptional regulator [Actinobacteria bacterium]|nr:MAG: Rrf2 family transcriptional regulator [Actinomycetota bacterium]
MRFTAKTEYAVRAIIEIALLDKDRPAQVKEIATRQAIPERFLEQVMAALKKDGLIESTRGSQGGYRLARSAEQITLADIIQAIEGPMQVIECLSEDLRNQKCEQVDLCAVRDVWKGVQSSLLEALDSITLAKLLEKYQNQRKAKAQQV